MAKGRGHFKTSAKFTLHVAGKLLGGLRVSDSEKEKPVGVHSAAMWTNTQLKSVSWWKSMFANHGKSTALHCLARFIGTITYAIILKVF